MKEGEQTDWEAPQEKTSSGRYRQVAEMRGPELIIKGGELWRF
jgi:hypothetical protein